MFLIYLPDGCKVYGAEGEEFEGAGSVLGVESYKVVVPLALRIHLFKFRQFCCRMYRLATMSHTDGWADRQTDRQHICTVLNEQIGNEEGILHCRFADHGHVG